MCSILEYGLSTQAVGKVLAPQLNFHFVAFSQMININTFPKGKTLKWHISSNLNETLLLICWLSTLGNMVCDPLVGFFFCVRSQNLSDSLSINPILLDLQDQENSLMELLIVWLDMQSITTISLPKTCTRPVHGAVLHEQTNMSCMHKSWEFFFFFTCDLFTKICNTAHWKVRGSLK